METNKQHPPKACNSGVIYWDMLQDLWNMEDENEDPAYILEYAKACFEIVLCEGVSTTDRSILRFMRPYAKMVDKARDRYKTAQDNKDSWMVENLQLLEVAELIKQGKTQKEIAERLNTNQSNISRRLKIIKEKHPEFLENYIEEDD